MSADGRWHLTRRLRG